MSWRRPIATPDMSQKNRLKCFHSKQANRYFYSGETGGRSELVRRNRSWRSNRPGAPTSWRWRFLVIEWCDMTARFRVTAGELNTSARCWNRRHEHERLSQKTIPHGTPWQYDRTSRRDRLGASVARTRHTRHCDGGALSFSGGMRHVGRVI